ncbi:MAG: MAPEG family protein [bacterium]
MSPELTALAGAGLLQAALYVLFAVPANLELGPAYTSSPRDLPPTRRMSVRTARMQRALANGFEALTYFTVAVVVVTLGGAASPFTHACAVVFLTARALYIPAYLFGWSPWRSAIWATGFFASVLMILAAMF